MSQRGKSNSAESRARLEKVRTDAAAKRAELGLEPVPPENLEYEAAMAERKARKRKRRGP